MRSRTFQRGTMHVSLCRSKGGRVTLHQTLMIIESSGTRTQVPRVWFNSGQAAELFSNLQIWQFVTLQPFDLLRPTVPLWKDLDLVANIHSFCSRDWQYFKDRNFPLKETPFPKCLCYRGLYLFAMAWGSYTFLRIDGYTVYTKFYYRANHRGESKYAIHILPLRSKRLGQFYCPTEKSRSLRKTYFSKQISMLLKCMCNLKDHFHTVLW